MAALAVLLHHHPDDRHGPDTVTVEAHPTPTPGLVVTPQLNAGSPIRGSWVVTHQPSTLAVTSGRNRDDAHRVAEHLGELPIDWTTTPEALAAAIAANGDAFAAATRGGDR